MKSSNIPRWCEIPLVKVSAKLAEIRDNLKRPVNSLIYQHENVGKFGSFVGQVETSVKQHVLANMQVLVKMSEFKDNIIISENSPFYQGESVGEFGQTQG